MTLAFWKTMLLKFSVFIHIKLARQLVWFLVVEEYSLFRQKENL